MSIYENEDIAIIGMACLFPGAENISEYWQNITHKRDCVTDPPPDWQPELFLDETGTDKDKVYVGKGGYLGELSRFDASKYGIMPSSIEGSEPDQFLALRCAVEALEDANRFGADVRREKTGIVLGRGTYVNRGYVTSLHHGFVIGQVLSVLQQVCPELTDDELEAIRSDLKAHIPPLNADTVPGLCHSVLVGRIANRMDLNGPAHTVDAACASSLLAVDAAMRELRSGRCDGMLAGGVQVSTPAVIDLMFCHLEALSRKGRVASFSAGADGTLLGEGCGVLVLKRRSDAERDGNRIYALLKGVGVSSDGRQGGLLAPQSGGQVIAIRQAYETTGIDPSTIGLIEAHGTGIPLGDRTEVQSLAEVFGSRVDDRTPVALGSVKSMISHLIPAAGVASMIKTALALYHRVLPPTLHGEEPDPRLGLDETPFCLSTNVRPWIHGDASTPRRAAIDAFGFGGINAHVVMEAHENGGGPLVEAEDLDREWPVELVVLSGASRDELRIKALHRADWLEQAKGVTVLDFAAACAEESDDKRVAICAADPAELVRKLRHVAAKLEEPERTKIQDRSGIFYYDEPLAREGRVAFLFPGEGAQYVDMLSELCRHFPSVRREFDITDEAFARAGLPRLMSRAVFPASRDRDEADGLLFEMQTAVESVTTANRALMSLTRSLGIRPDGILGHSSGEFAALVAAGAIRISDREELIQIILAGVDCTAELNNASLVPEAVLTTVGGAGAEVVEQVVTESRGGVTVALDNCPHQVVIAGDAASMKLAVQRLQSKGGMCEQLGWNRAYHTKEFGPACDALERYFGTLDFRTPDVELWSCSSQSPYPSDLTAMRALAVRQWQSPVRFRETIENMYAAGYRVFVEVGPRGNLSAFVSDTLSGRPHAAVALDIPSKPDLVQLCRAVGQLVARGVSVDLAPLYERRRPVPLDFTASPPPAVQEMPVLRLDLPVLTLSTSLVEKLRAPREAQPPNTERTPTPMAAQPRREQDYADFQETMRAFLATQESAMKMFLGGDGSSAGPIEALSESPRVESPVSAEAAIEAPPEQAPAPQEAIPQEALEDVLTQVISDRTGYPPEIIEPDADLEAELGIDSIKRVEIIATFRRMAAPEVTEPPSWFMEEMTEARTARDIVRGVEALAAGHPGGEPPEASPPRLPLLSRIIAHEAERRLEAECELDAESQPFLRDHTFGESISVRDPSLRALTVMPLAMTMELMAEAAAALAGDKIVVRMIDVDVLGWFAFDRPKRLLHVVARRDGTVVTVEVSEADRPGQPALARARVELAEQTPSLEPTLPPATLDHTTRWTPDSLYREGMFHGPSFRSVVAIQGFSDGAVRATLRRPEDAPLLSTDEDGSLVLPVALLDGVGQVLGLWRAESALKMCFPTRLARLELGGAGVGDDPELILEATVRRSGGADWLSDAELTDPTGAVVLRLSGRCERDVDLPEAFWRYRVNPTQLAFSRSLAELFSNVPGIDECGLAVVDTFGGSFLVELDGLWALDLSRYILSRRERDVYAKLDGEPFARATWLLERVALKDAARLRLNDPSLRMPDIETDTSGEKLSFGAGPASDLVSGGAHRGYVAAAIVGDGDVFAGVGLAIEPANSRDLVDDWPLTDGEEALVARLLADSGGERGAWTAAFSSAKAALARAENTTDSTPLEIIDVDPLMGLYTASSPRSGTVAVYCKAVDDHVLAVCLLLRDSSSTRNSESNPRAVSTSTPRKSVAAMSPDELSESRSG